MFFPKTDIYAITDSGLCLGRTIPCLVTELIQAGVIIIQYREKNKSSGAMFEECKEIRRLTAEAGVCFLVNDHVDIAMLVDADGVHIGQDDLPLSAVRQLLGPDKIIGVSAGTIEEAQKAVAGGADYLGIGPICKTETKKDAGRPTGLSFLEEIAASCPVPFAVIGGIKRDNIAELARHGASCFCLISEIVGAPDISGRVNELRQCLAR